MTDISFGPSTRPWHYFKSTKTYDLSGKSSNKLQFSATEGPEGTHVAIDPSSTALVIIDMQNFFLDARCMEHREGLAAVEPTIKVIEKCRAAGIRVIWLNWGLTDHDMSTMPGGVQRGFMKDMFSESTAKLRPWIGLGAELPDDQGRCLFADTWNAHIYPPLKKHVQPDDIHVPKNRMSGLWSTEQPLWKALEEKKITTVMYAGVNTDQCVLGTFVDGYNAGWNSILIDDCCGTPTLGAKEVTLLNIASCYGFVTNSTSLVDAKAV